jgi:hypothetical protein
MGRIINPCTVQLNDADVQIARSSIARIKKQVGNNDRGNPQIDSEFASLSGMCSEIACLYVASAILMVSVKSLIEMWWEDNKNRGSNYGRDILKHVFGLDLDIEVKGTTHYGPDKGFLFMRVASGVGYAVQKFSFWEKNLPDSYYVLFITRRNHTYELVCWATRQMLLDNFKVWCKDYKIRMPFGYDTLGIVHHMANSPKTFLPKLESVKMGR